MFLPYTLLPVLVCSVATDNFPKQCITPNNEPAECISLLSCPPLLDALATKQQASIDFVRKSGCGFTGSTPLVCCGINSTTLEPRSATATLRKTCSAPSGHTGECIAIGDCPGLIEIFANYANGTEELLNQFLCKNHYVCCPSYLNSNLYNQIPASQTHCGLQRTDDHISSPTYIGLDEFPWLAALVSEDKINRKKEILCQGTLINHKYVITAAHCILNQKYPVTTVRLGEYDIRNSLGRLFCVASSEHSIDCTTAEEYAIEEIITHHFYSSETGQNDIALIRLVTAVTYSAFIRPICLPTPDMTSIRPGDTLYASGWGKARTGNKSEIKKKIRATLIGNEECQNMLNEFKTTIIITEYNMCTLDEDDSRDFSCLGDGGSPVMFSYNLQWYLEGIISEGIGCGRKVPDVQTKVVRYLNWINYNLKP